MIVDVSTTAIMKGGLLLVAFLAGAQGFELIQGFAGGPKPYTLAPEKLSYSDGKVHQKMHVDGIAAIPGAWSAEIDRHGQTICRGAGNGLYDKEEYKAAKKFTPRDWTGDKECPEYLRTGDTLRAVWTYTDLNGQTVNVSTSFVVP